MSINVVEQVMCLVIFFLCLVLLKDKIIRYFRRHGHVLQGGVVMDKAKLNEHKEVLLKLKQKILGGGILRSSEDLTISPEDLADETDLATSVINQQVTFNIRSRELQKLRQVEMALQKIEDGSYGSCDDCDEFIGEVRLRNQPWASLCIIHAEERERESSKYVRHA